MSEKRSLHLKTVISGSYRKHLKELISLRNLLERANIEVLSPVSAVALNPNDEFILLDTDPTHNHHILQDSIFAKILASSFLVLAKVGGYIGNAALMEVGYSIAYNLQIFTLEPVTDPNIAPYCKPISIIPPEITGTYEEEKRAVL